MPIKEEELEKITQILTPYGFKVVNKTTLGPRCELDGEIDHILFQFEYIFDNAPMLNYLQFDKFHLGPEHTITVKAEKLAELCKNIQFESLVTSVENLRISSNIPIEAVVLCTEHNKNVEGLLLIPNVVKRQSSMLEDGTVDSKRDRFIIYEFEVYGLLKTKEIVRTEIDYLIEILDNWTKKEKIKGAIFTIPPYEKIQHLIAEEEKTIKQVYLEEE
ncbi:MAG: hypothetical protein K9W46_03115 [Candidatus Heimdallarchaeum endolithica]|uniref:Uncharacterized protein n=1 Tax=Candidatus Heimdallarchaeum endolithica TaxID=2876572 RepID=A0A9Y1BSJ5_9ARCH|nr:MAG: hypothetical protein K9W46_03115 [Candidatus Heimdallarchaeum endolithica]